MLRRGERELRGPRGIAVLSQALLLSVVASACAGMPGGPVGTVPGASKESAAGTLKSRGFCAPDDLFGKTLIFERCNRPGLELFTSRVVAIFDEGKVKTASRIEVFEDEAAAMRRWHDLVSERSEGATESAAQGRTQSSRGLELLTTSGSLPEGSVSWVVWQRSEYVHAVVYAKPPVPSAAGQTATGQASHRVVELVAAMPSRAPVR